MRLRNIKNAKDIVNNCPLVIKDSEHYKGKFNNLFGNDNPIELEIGMGKGDFLIDKALKNPNINFIGVEMYESVLCRAIQKLECLDIKNIRVICIDAIELGNVFDHEINKIYLNFSDPWPKKRHAKRRLTSHRFLDVYENIFNGDAVIEQKTDNVGLFESSIVSLSTYGYKIEEISLDLHSTDKENSETEYEKKFVSQGIKINYLRAIKK